jgi:hypothetical protein
VHEELVKEIQSKPLSWISKVEQQMNSINPRKVEVIEEQKI